jgi:hypothetical protein
MTTFQLDQCLDSKRFARDCAAQGLCQTARLSPSLRDADDPELLRALMVSPRPLVTFDRTLPHEHTASIPAQHPGIIVISNYPAPQTMTVRIAQRVLGRFKAAFHEWHIAAWSNSVVEVSTIGVEVWHVDGQRLVRDTYLGFDSADWQSRLTSVLQRNSRLDPAGGADPTT